MNFHTFENKQKLPKILVEKFVYNGTDITTENADHSYISYADFFTIAYDKIGIGRHNDTEGLEIFVRRIDTNCKNPFTAYSTLFLSFITLGIIPCYSIYDEKYCIATIFPNNKTGELYFTIESKTYMNLGILGGFFPTRILLIPKDILTKNDFIFTLIYIYSQG